MLNTSKIRQMEQQNLQQAIENWLDKIKNLVNAE